MAVRKNKPAKERKDGRRKNGVPRAHGNGYVNTRTPEAVAEILDRLKQGEPLLVICRDPHLPAARTFQDWYAADRELHADYMIARSLGWDAIAHRTRSIARGAEGSSGDIQRDKLIIDTDLRLLAKWDSGRYGDKLTQEITGKDGGPIEHKYAGLTDEQIKAEIARRMAQLT